MLDHLAARHGIEKAAELLRRLSDKRVDQVLPAEMELGLLWALDSLGDMDVEPKWWGDDKRPDAYSEAFVPGLPTVIEITSLSDNTLSGVGDMDGVARQISACANTAAKGVGDHLYFRFQEESGYHAGQYYRRRLAPRDYVLSDAAARVVRAWVQSGQTFERRLRIVEPGLDVEVERTSHKQIRRHNVFSTMPPETHSLDKNPLAAALKRKLPQLKASPRGAARLIFVADVGSTLLNRLGSGGEFDPTRRRVSGREILTHFVLKHQARVDGVVVFTARRPRRSFGHHERPAWSGHIFAVDAYFGRFTDGVERLCARLPTTHMEGYQVRSLFHQGVFAPTARGRYLSMSYSGGKNMDSKVRISTRLLLDLLAGRITEKQFRYFSGERDGRNDFKHWLDHGMTLTDIAMAPRELDEDDDHLVLTFRDDPAARELTLATPPASPPPSESDTTD